MSIDARSPPSQFVFRLRRALGGRAGWNGFVFQLLFVAALIWLGTEIIANARANLAAQRITSGFGFLENNAGFDVSQSLISYTGSDSYVRVFFVGLLNTLLVAVVGIFFATILGFAVALGRLSPNWLLSRIAGGYVELIRNLPPLFQILFWYKAVLAALPNPRQSYSIFDYAFLSNRGLVIPKAIESPGFYPFWIAIAVAVVAAFVMRRYARKQLLDKGNKITIWPYVLGGLIGLPLLAMLVFGQPFTLEFPDAAWLQLCRRLAPDSRIRGADAGAGDLHGGVHRRDRASGHHVRAQGADGGGLIARPVARPDAADDRGAAGDAGDPAAADQPVSQPDEKLLAGGRDRLSRPRLGVCRHDAEPDRAGDRDHLDHHGRLFADFAHHKRDHEFVRVPA